ncbi:hypothetical protein QZH41_008974, partial [Actinostola sp. cb2023]
MYTSLVDSVTAAMTPTKRGSNNRNCAVPLCRSYGNLFDKEHNRKVTYHAIPKASNEKRLWLTKIRREEKSGFKVKNHTVVCSLHFKDEDLERSGYSGR